MIAGGGAAPLMTNDRGMVASMAGKVCFAPYIRVERAMRPEPLADCTAPFTTGCVPDHSASLVVDPWVEVSLGLFDKNGLTAVNILEGRPRGEDLLELVKFNMVAAASSVYAKVDAMRKFVVTSIDYDITLDALRGKLGVHLGSALASVADGLYTSMVNIMKIWDKAAQIPTTLSDFKANYLDLDKSFDLVKFPDRLSFKRTTRLNPVVFYLDGPGSAKTMLAKDGCACFKALNGLCDVRASLLNHLGCMAGRFTGADAAAYKAQTLALFSGIEETCLNYLGSDECAEKRSYLDKKNRIITTSPLQNFCADEGAPGVLSHENR